MANPPRSSPHDPGAGLREAIERELQRKGSERKPATSEKRPLERASEWRPLTRALPGRRRDSSRPR